MKANVNLFILSLQDLLTPKMLKYTLIPFVATLGVMYLLFFAFAGMGVEYLGNLEVTSTQTTLQNGVPHTEEFSAKVEGEGLFSLVMHYLLSSWMASFFVYVVGAIITLYLSIFLTLIIIGFMTPYVLRELQLRHYKEIPLQGHSNIIEALFNMLRWAFVMLLLFVLLTPLYFIPLLNIIALNLPLYYFFHKMLHYDIASNMLTKEQARKIRLKKSSSLRLKSLGLYTISLIPFSVFFSAIFFVIYLGHTYFRELAHLKEMR